MIIWQCGLCGKLYSHDDLMTAELLPICECGEDLFDSTTYHHSDDDSRTESLMLYGLDS